MVVFMSNISKLSSICCKHNESLINIIKKLEQNKKGFVILIDEQNMVKAVVTDGDIRRYIIKNYSNLNLDYPYIIEKNYYPICLSSSKFDFVKLSQIFAGDKIKCIPIVDNDNKIINCITKNQFHISLLHNRFKNFNYNYEIFEKYTQDLDIMSRPWGFYKSILLTDIMQSKMIIISPNQAISLQKHRYREEHWIVLHGQGQIILESSHLNAYPGKYVFIPKGAKHRIVNTSTKNNLIFFELQMGDYFGEDDIIRYEDKYNRS